MTEGEEEKRFRRAHVPQAGPDHPRPQEIARHHGILPHQGPHPVLHQDFLLHHAPRVLRPEEAAAHRAVVQEVPVPAPDEKHPLFFHWYVHVPHDGLWPV